MCASPKITPTNISLSTLFIIYFFFVFYGFLMFVFKENISTEFKYSPLASCTTVL